MRTESLWGVQFYFYRRQSAFDDGGKNDTNGQRICYVLHNIYRIRSVVGVGMIIIETVLVRQSCRDGFVSTSVSVFDYETL